MSVKFVEAMQYDTNWTKTENGADALKSTTNALLDLFGVIGALRTRNDREVIDLFSKAFVEDKLLAMKMSFYARDVRNGGLGERKVPRVIWEYLALNYPDIMEKNMEFVPHFGRWDDLFIFIDTNLEKAMWYTIGKQWNEDVRNMIAGEPISLMGKWLKSINASSRETVAIAKKTAKALGLSEVEYRKSLSAFRKYLDIVECKMSRKEFDKITYKAVPSKAMMIYRSSFARNDNEGFTSYIESLVKGETKINASTLFPYEILGKMTGGSGMTIYRKDEVLEAQWKALPNYVSGENNVIVMADTSGSMMGQPILSSLGLAMYFAERNKGAYKDVFMTFDSRPSFVTLKGDSLFERIKNVKSINANTNLEAGFQLILDVALKNKISNDEMPKALVIISDMEFDQATRTDWGSNKNNMTFYDAMKSKFEKNGYEIPNVIFWNVQSRQNVFHAFSDYKGVQLASGQSPSVFMSIMKNIGLNPVEAMVNTLSNPAYDCITI